MIFNMSMASYISFDANFSLLCHHKKIFIISLTSRKPFHGQKNVFMTARGLWSMVTWRIDNEKL